jgi:hypothetical protein
MSRYLLLVIINAPLLLVGIIGALTHYNTKRISKKRCYAEVAFWVVLGIGLCLAQPAYNALIRHNLTNSEPMSLFDMILLTFIIFCLLLIKSSNEHTAELHRKISRMHERIAIDEAHRREKAGDTS